ncbi:MAG: SRPBCC family protein [Bacillota bacterium]
MKEIHCYRFESEIDSTIDLVSECLNKDEHVLKWNTQIIENMYDGSEDDLVEGATFITKQKLGKKVYEFHAKCTRHDPPNYATVETKTKEGISKTEYILKETPEGTNFIVNVSLIPSNWIYKLATHMFKWSFKHVYDEQFDNFIEYVYQIEYERGIFDKEFIKDNLGIGMNKSEVIDLIGEADVVGVDPKNALPYWRYDIGATDDYENELDKQLGDGIVHAIDEEGIRNGIVKMQLFIGWRDGEISNISNTYIEGGKLITYCLRSNDGAIVE